MNKYKNKTNISSKAIRDARTAKKMSLEKLSNMLQLVDVTLYANDLYLIENEKRIVKDFELLAICDILEIDIEKIKQELQ